MGEYYRLDKFGYPRTSSGPDSALQGPSYGARRTARNNDLIARGQHPATKLKLLDAEWGYKCKGCTHAYKAHGGSRSFWKCALVPHTHGPGTDIRINWPACQRYRETSD